MITRVSCIVILSMLLPVRGSAQPVPREGERVRIHLLDDAVVIGIVQTASPQAVRLLGTGGVRSPSPKTRSDRSSEASAESASLRGTSESRSRSPSSDSAH